MAKPSHLREKPKRLTKAQKSELVETFIKRLRKKLPDPKCELYYETPYQLLVSVVLSAQTTDKMVNRCMEPLYKQGFTPDSAIQLGPDGILKKIRQIGLAPTKSKNVFNLSKIILEQHRGCVPDSRDALEALPGVGRKTANVILGEIFHHPTLAVDTHVYRVSKRLSWHNESSPQKSESVLLRLIPEKYLPAAHHWLILHGRYTCKAQRPLCDECVLADCCPSLET